MQFLPLFKPGKIDNCNADNYRAISQGSIIFKVFELIFLSKFQNILPSHQNQFGFKMGHSTTSCVWALKEVILYYVVRCTGIYACFLDCTKAFDTVNHSVLFQKLLDCGISGSYLQLLFYCYRNQRGYVRWADADSDCFPIRNGVRQGGILSPLFFNIYIFNLLTGLPKAGLGCHFAGIFAGVFTYADDIALLSPSISALRKMLAMCETYAVGHALSFNASKTVCMYFPSKRPVHEMPNITSVSLAGESLSFVDRFCYLGIWINPYLDDNMHFSNLVSDFYRKFNACYSKFGFCSRQVLLYLVSSYCTSFYGAACCMIDTVQFNCLAVAWNKCMRRILRVPYRTHVALLPQLTGLSLASVQIKCRMLKFAYQCITSSNPLVACLARHSAISNVHLLGCNLSTVLREVNGSVRDFRRVPTLFLYLQNLFNQISISRFCVWCGIHSRYY
jgi:hypothetical protein